MAGTTRVARSAGSAHPWTSAAPAAPAPRQRARPASSPRTWRAVPPAACGRRVHPSRHYPEVCGGRQACTRLMGGQGATPCRRRGEAPPQRGRRHPHLITRGAGLQRQPLLSGPVVAPSSSPRPPEGDRVWAARRLPKTRSFCARRATKQRRLDLRRRRNGAGGQRSARCGGACATARRRRCRSCLCSAYHSGLCSRHRLPCRPQDLPRSL